MTERKYGLEGVDKVQEGRELEGQGKQRGRGLELVGVEQAGKEKKQGEGRGKIGFVLEVYLMYA